MPSVHQYLVHICSLDDLSLGFGLALRPISRAWGRKYLKSPIPDRSCVRFFVAFQDIWLYFSRIYYNMLFSLAIAALAGSASSTILWDGRFNGMSSSTDLLEWSWSDEVGPYQYYIVCPGFYPILLQLIPPARLRKRNILRQSLSFLQEPGRFGQHSRSQNHTRQYFILEWTDNAKNGVDSPDDCRYKLGEGVVSFQHDDVDRESSEHISGASDQLFRVAFHGDEGRVDIWRGWNFGQSTALGRQFDNSMEHDM